MRVRIEDRSPAVRVALLDRPAQRNAIDMPMVVEITQAIETAPGMVVVLGSTGASAFSAGADLGLGDSERAAVSNALYDLYRLMRSTPRILIAAAGGHAVGGGAQLMVAADVRMAGPGLTVRFVGPGHGLVVGAWGLPSLIGRGRAIDLCLSMREVGAEEALQIGLVDRVVDDPLLFAIEYAESVARLDESAVAKLKQIVGVTRAEEALRLEAAHNAAWDGAVARRPQQGK
jgi:enoyl-CoA hydratase